MSLVGGKWTTFRRFAEEVADKALSPLGRTHRTSTADLRTGGGKAFPDDRSVWTIAHAKAHGLSARRADVLLSRYGTTVATVMAHTGPSGALEDAPDYSLSELDWLLRHEQVRHLADLIVCRTTLAITGHLTHGNLTQIAALATQTLGWTQRPAEAGVAAMNALTEKHLIRF